MPHLIFLSTAKWERVMPVPLLLKGQLNQPDIKFLCQTSTFGSICDSIIDIELLISLISSLSVSI